MYTIITSTQVEDTAKFLMRVIREIDGSPNLRIVTFSKGSNVANIYHVYSYQDGFIFSSSESTNKAFDLNNFINPDAFLCELQTLINRAETIRLEQNWQPLFSYKIVIVDLNFKSDSLTFEK